MIQMFPLLDLLNFLLLAPGKNQVWYQTTKFDLRVVTDSPGTSTNFKDKICEVAAASSHDFPGLSTNFFKNCENGPV